MRLNPTYLKRILHLVSFKNITFKSSYNWFKINIHQQLRPLTANYLAMFKVISRGKYFFIFKSNKERNTIELNTLPLGELIPAKPAVPVDVTQAQTIGFFLIIFPPRVTDSFIWTVSHLVIKRGYVPTILNSLLAVGCLNTFENVSVPPSLLPWCFCCCPDWRWLHQLWSPWPSQLPGRGTWDRCNNFKLQ